MTGALTARGSYSRESAVPLGKMARGAEIAVKTTTAAIDAAYRVTGAKDAVDGARDLADRTGMTSAARTVAGATGDALDTVTGKRILALVEERLDLQARYNDVLASKLEEALHRIRALEAEVGTLKGRQ